MSMETKAEMQTAVAWAGEAGDALKARMRDLGLQSRRKQQADPQTLRKVRKEAVAGIGEGLGRRGQAAGVALMAALQGLNEAMAKAVYTLRLTLEGLTRPAVVLRLTGTDTGVHVPKIAERLQTRLSTAADGAPAEVKAAAQRAGECLAEVASGILRGLDGLEARRG